MPKYEYECGNGHKRLVKFPFAPNLPPPEIYCGDVDTLCTKMLQRRYSPVSFTMS